MGRSLFFHPLQFARWPPRVLGIFAGRANDAPYLLLSAFITDQHAQQCFAIHPVVFYAALAAIDFNARRVHYAYSNAQRSQLPRNPKTVATDFVTALYRRILRQPELLFRSAHLLVEATPICCVDYNSPQSHAAIAACEHPLALAQFERNEQNTIAVKGRLGNEKASFQVFVGASDGWLS